MTSTNRNVRIFGFYTSDFKKVLENAKVLKAEIKPTVKLMEHPLETGAMVTDFKIIKPVEIDISLMLLSENYADVYQTLKNFYNKSTSLIVQTKTDVYKNMVIESFPYEESADVYDGITLALTVKEILYATTSTSTSSVNTKTPKHKTKIDRGQQQTKETPVGPSIAHGIFFK